MAEAKAKSKGKFLKLGAYRMNKTLARIRQIGHLCAYPHDKADAEKMFKALRVAVDAAEARFKKGIVVDGFTFADTEESEKE